MKKFISFLLSIVLLVTSFGAFTASGAVTITIEYGDVNASGIINGKDATVLMQYINGWDVDGFFVSVADIVLDNTINNKDYVQLVRYLNGWDVRLGVPLLNGGLVNDGVDPSDYWGKTIKFISTIDPAVDESGPVVENFEKEYGITVQIIPSGLDEHAQKIMGLIAADQSPDVARSNGDFPAFLGYMQSLDAAKLDYNEPIWNQNTFKMTTFGGSPYLCDTVGNIWAEADIVMYSKSLLRRANAYTPEEYDAMGKWTWEAFFEIGNAVQKVNGGKPGCAINSYECFYHAAGGSVYKLNNERITNGFNSKTVEIMTKYSQARKDNILMFGKSVTAALMEGEIGITTLHAWSLKKTGDLRNGKWDDYGFYYLPYYDEAAAATGIRSATGVFKGWGICKGAKEPVAAGLFLREYLDVNNYDVGGTFITPDAERFFFEVTNIDYSNYNPYFTYIDMNYFITGVKSTSDIYAGMYYDPNQVNTIVAAAKSAVDKGVNNINTFIEQNINSR